jgi:DNA primase
MAPGKDDAMPKYFPRHLLYRLRNEIPLERVIAEHLNWPGKRREGRFSFVCPRCGESLTAVNPQTNLGRCFRCEENFNAIDFVMLATQRDFVEAVHFLSELLPPRPSTLPAAPAD